MSMVRELGAMTPQAPLSFDVFTRTHAHTHTNENKTVLLEGSFSGDGNLKWHGTRRTRNVHTL
jgi:hypothetical protein